MTQPMNIRWGLAGTGAIARRFANDIRHIDNATLAAICARDPAKAQVLADHQPGVATFGSLSEMVASPNVDAVYIATPNTVHYGQALECIAARIPVLVEKPLTANLDQALEIQAAARKAGVFVMEAMWSRYLPAFQAARKAIHEGVLGKVRRFDADIARKLDYDPESRFFSKSYGGGSLHDIGIYPISLARFFFGDPDKIEATWRSAPSGVDLSASITMQFGETEARLGCGFDRNGDDRMLIEGDKGVLVLGPLFIQPQGFAVYPTRRLADLAQPGGNALQARIRRKLFRHLPVPGSQWHSHPFEGTGLQFEIEAASEAIRRGLIEEPGNSLDDTIAALQIIDGVLARPPMAG